MFFLRPPGRLFLPEINDHDSTREKLAQSTKEIGKRRNKGTGAASDHITTPLETQDYEYNIRGWLLGVNRAYVKQKSTTDSLNTATTTGVISGEMFTESSADLQVVTFPSSNYFGFDLGYDKKNNDRINIIPYDSEVISPV